jgi:hypothetical protein
MRLKSIVVSVLLTCVLGCEGFIGDTQLGPSGRPDVDGGTIVDRGPPVGASRLALISREEYDFSIRDVFFGLEAPISELPEDYFGAIRFVDNHQQPLQATTAEQYENTAWEIADAIATGTFPATHPSNPNQSRLNVLLAPLPECAVRDASCAVAMAAHYGERLWRRPLSGDELDELRGLFEWTLRPGTEPDFADGGSGTFADGIRVTLAALLAAPEFIFRAEPGEPTVEPDLVTLDGEERAARLAAFLWRSVPDENLSNVARDGLLSTPAQVAEQARRMLADPRAERMWSALARAWLITDPILHDSSHDLSGDSALWTPEVAEAAAHDVHEFIIHIARSGGTLEELFTSSGGVSQGATLEWIVGVSRPTGEWIESMPNRHGLLTLPGVMAANNHSGFTSALIRGLFLRRSILCHAIPPPPLALADTISLLSRTLPDLENPTRRELLAAVTQSGEPCATCHQLTNDVGFAFAAFDDFGRFRTSEMTVRGPIPVDASGYLRPVSSSSATSADGPFENHLELIDRLAVSPQVARCTTRQLSRLALGREVALGDEDSLDQTIRDMESSGGVLTELVVSIVSSESFLSRRIPPSSGL